MKLVRWTLFLAAIAVAAPATDINGTWKAVFTGPMGDRPKMVSEMTFDLHADGAKLAGTAHMSAWPGDASFNDGTIEGDHFSFTVVGKSPWKSNGPSGAASGLPKLTFTGTIQGKDMQLTCVWGSAMIEGIAPPDRELAMKGEKTSD